METGWQLPGFECQDDRTSLGESVSSFKSNFQSVVNGSPGISTWSSVFLNRRQRKSAQVAMVR